MKQGNCCFVCKIMGALVVIGAINWGLIGVFQKDPLAGLFMNMPGVGRAVYVLIGLAGLLKLISCFKPCPCCKTGCETKS